MIDKDVYKDAKDTILRTGKYDYSSLSVDITSQIYFMLQEDGIPVDDNVYENCFELGG